MGMKRALLGARIKELRRRVGMSQDQLAERVGIEGKYISRIEVGRRSPSLETLEKIADSLDVEMKELFDFSHHSPEVASPRGIERALEGATKEELTLIFKLIEAVRK
ncbi:hypothetical protein GMST_10790 [Geomonas silvestris]|uniref:HTH cro/C1-type domain-containing protein n=1 Tax=Geomonas silvestris TaxID=2740184 RepID=A0A6V8MFT7_9BACT|nr:helix-turn-helix transcriptional regulator [Geomonas silvestris]GFO58754.1 hypothetical protein GMST_10790 [Geomonas silvestris]